jgi:hypothetical protein
MKRHGMHIGNAAIFYLSEFARGNFELDGSTRIDIPSNKDNIDEYGYLPEFILNKVSALDNQIKEWNHGKFGLILHSIIISVFVITLVSFLFLTDPNFPGRWLPVGLGAGVGPIIMYLIYRKPC